MTTATSAPPAQAGSSRPRVPASLQGVAYGDRAFKLILTCAAALIPILLGFLLLELWQGSRMAIAKFGLDFIRTSVWDPVAGQFGAFPLIFGTLLSSFLALLIAVPLSLGVAIYLTEFEPKALRQPVFPLLRSALGFLPFFSGPIYGPSMLAASIILAIMVMPYIMSVSREVLLAVPNSQREAALALGATRWEAVITAVVPYARSGIMGAVILGLGRALGETMAVTLLIGNRHEIAASLFAPGYTMAAAIANEFTEAATNLHFSALTYVALVLFVLTVLVNAGARILIWRVARGSAVGSKAL